MDTEVLIIGAGPYGFSLAYDLHVRGISFEMIGEPFSLWLSHTLSHVHLRSDWRASQIFSRDGQWDLHNYLLRQFPMQKVAHLQQGRVPGPLFRNYLRWVITSMPFRVVQQRVVSLQAIQNGFLARTNHNSEIRCRKVVVATGIESHRYLPSCLQGLPGEKVVHGWEVNGYATLKGKNLLIIGGGQSAAEAVVLLAPSNEITWVHRSHLIFYSEPINLPKPLFELALRLSAFCYLLPHRLHRLMGRRFVEATITPELKQELSCESIKRHHLDVNQLALADQSCGIYSQLFERLFDRVIACTGYRYSLKTLGFLSPALLKEIHAEEGVPRLAKDFSTSVPNLYMIGGIAEPTHGPAQRFMFGCRDATCRVGQALARR